MFVLCIVPFPAFIYCYSNAPWLWSLDKKKMSILFQFDSFIHLPLLFIKFYSSISVLTCLIKAFLGMAGEKDGSRTYTSLVKSTEGSDIEYVNQIPDPDYVNVC